MSELGWEAALEEQVAELRKQLLKMEDERDAALLDVEGSRYLLADLQLVLNAAQAWRVGRSTGYAPGSPVAALVAAIDAFNETWGKKS